MGCRSTLAATTSAAGTSKAGYSRKRWCFDFVYFIGVVEKLCKACSINGNSCVPSDENAIKLSRCYASPPIAGFVVASCFE